MKIKITKNGPYLVTGNIPLYEKAIRSDEKNLPLLVTKRKIQTEETYALCRCGKSKNPPFCDGQHGANNFDGSEVADRSTYNDRATCQEGQDLILYDDNRCAYARFCHRENGDVWTLTQYSGSKENRDQAIEGSLACPAGRLVPATKEGEILEKPLEASISIVQDPIEGVSTGIFVTGPIELESIDGSLYEMRNRKTLCRCGSSRNKPFCDARHVHSRFNDGHIRD